MATITVEAGPEVEVDDDVGYILNVLSSRVGAEPHRWRDHIFTAISRWSLPSEEISDEPHVYFIGGEAFNWRRLAERLAWHIAFLLPEEEELAMGHWLEDDHMFGGLEESQFRRVLGHEKWRAFLNYFYGVTLERCLALYAGSRIAKAKFGGGQSVSDDMLDGAFEALYGETEQALWIAFATESGLRIDSGVARSLAIDDEFTYWCFKRRIGTTYLAHVAHEVKHGLEALASITEADKRRKQLLSLKDCRELLEFKLSKRLVNRGANSGRVLVDHA